MIRTTSKELVFYQDFEEMVSSIHEAALKLEDLLENYVDTKAKIAEIAQIEHKCDVIVHRIYERVNASFITPIDREDIIFIAKALDEIVDQIEEIGYRFQIYNIKEIKPEVKTLGNTLTSSIEHVKELIGFLPKKQFKEMRHHIIEVNRLENQGDEIYREQITKLFENSNDAKEILSWNGIYDYFEAAIDACEDVANGIEGVVMKYA